MISVTEIKLAKRSANVRLMNNQVKTPAIKCKRQWVVIMRPIAKAVEISSATAQENNMTHIIILIVGMAAGYLLGSVGARTQRNEDIQRLIDIEATRRRADGIHRKGDILTEYERSESGAGFGREVKR